MGGATLYIEARGGLENDLSLNRYGNHFDEAASARYTSFGRHPALSLVAMKTTVPCCKQEVEKSWERLGKYFNIRKSVYIYIFFFSW